MPKKFIYAEAGVDRELRKEAKAGLDFEKTFQGKVIKLPYGNIYRTADGKYQDHVIEGIGTKVLVAQLANKYDTIGIDAVAMAVNDVIRSGAIPISLADNIDMQISEPSLVNELKKGIIQGALESGVIIPSGEIADVKDLIKGVEGKGFHIVCSCVGHLSQNEIIWGNELKVGDIIIGLRSTGLHSNGISLARRILFKQWGGKYEPFDKPETLDREVVYEVLEPTKIYVKPFLKVAKEYKIKAAVHITGDAYLKFEKLMKFNPKIGFEFDNFKPHPVFQLIQDTAEDLGGIITDEEMMKTFNMGWGFAVIVNKKDNDDIIGKFGKLEIEAEKIGRITDSRKIVVVYKGNTIELW